MTFDQILAAVGVEPPPHVVTVSIVGSRHIDDVDAPAFDLRRQRCLAIRLDDDLVEHHTVWPEKDRTKISGPVASVPIAFVHRGGELSRLSEQIESSESTDQAVIVFHGF